MRRENASANKPKTERPYGDLSDSRDWKKKYHIPRLFWYTYFVSYAGSARGQKGGDSQEEPQRV